MKYIYALLLILISPLGVFALEGFSHTTTFSIKELPENSIDKPAGIKYDKSQIVGTLTSDLVGLKYEDIVDIDNQRRIPNMLDRVALPPMSKIDLRYYWNIEDIGMQYIEVARVMLSRSLTIKGDLTRIVTSNITQKEVLQFFEGETCALLHGVERCRGGKYLEAYQLWNIFPFERTGKPISNFTVNLPFEIEENGMEIIDESRAILRVKIKNNSPYHLWGVEYRHGEFSSINYYQPFQSYTFEYESTYQRYKHSYKFGFATIKNDTMHTECAVLGANLSDQTKIESVSVHTYIQGNWESGAQLQPSVESFCITRIPFEMSTPEIIITPDVDIFNLETLPITFKSVFVLIKEWVIDKLKVL